MRTPSTHHHLTVINEPVDFDPDPYLVDEPAMTLDDWRHVTLPDDGDVERVQLHQRHFARLVA
jgi:hypothetical protein